ncbi:MAG: hypothetical protein RMK30_03610 [Anaerolineae bacterium]|nr:hypothetical protein [Anaerolineae bacterium]MDW8101944.1 hypothetical protein [Anaerolineae bacterium]
MSTREEILRKTVESLLEDERLRSNFTDYEAEAILGWATRWLEKRILTAPEEKIEEVARWEKERLKNFISSLNNMFLYTRSPTLALAMGLVEKHLNEGRPFSAREVIEWITSLAEIIWEKREGVS